MTNFIENVQKTMHFLCKNGIAFEVKCKIVLQAKGRLALKVASFKSTDAKCVFWMFSIN